MKPCSAWCRPEEGLHVVLEWWSDPVDVAARAWIGRWDIWVTDMACVPPNTRVRYVSIEDAPEMPEVGTDGFKYPSTTTIYTDWRPSLEEAA